jgi:hypothetical protein
MVQSIERPFNRVLAGGPSLTWDAAQRTTSPPGGVVLLSNGDLTAGAKGGTDGSSGTPIVRSTTGPSSGNRYLEITVTGRSTDGNGSALNASFAAGVVLASWLPSLNDIDVGIGYEAVDSWGIRSDGSLNRGGWDWVSNYVSAVADGTGAVIRVAVKIDIGKGWIGINGEMPGDPVAGTDPAFTFPPGSQLFAGAEMYGDNTHYTELTINSGASAFAYALPAGFVGFGN